MAGTVSFLLLLVAGLCEIAARYLGWGWIRQGRGILWGVVGSAAMLASLFLPALQDKQFEFGRSSAAYGILFVVLALLWSWLIDRKSPDLYDVIGAALCLAGLSIIMYYPRS